MTIDEAITLLKFNNKHIADLKNDDLQQIAEWLEELKILKSLKNCSFMTIGKTVEQFEQEIRYKAIDDFSHKIKETFNLEIPLNYPSTKPFFTLENARKLVEDVAERLKRGDAE